MPDDLRVLGFDTSAAHCAAAVISGGRVLAERAEPMTKGQAERLFPLLEEVLAEAELSWADLDAIGVGIGPGNFTGIRISVAAARGLALSLGIPAVGVSATEAAAADVPRPCRAVVPLRGDEIVWQDFPAIEDEPAGQGAHPIRDAAESAGVAHSGSTGASAGDDALGPRLGKADALPPGPAVCVPVHPVAVAIARLAGDRVAACRADGEGAGMTPPATAMALPRPAPLYLRPADAAPPKDPAPVILR